MRGLYLGELLEHTVNMLNLVPVVCSNYPQIDQDLLATGVILHDIGKIEEYEQKTPINFLRFLNIRIIIYSSTYNNTYIEVI
jgi:3'-5' exoribonuclease